MFEPVWLKAYDKVFYVVDTNTLEGCTSFSSLFICPIKFSYLFNVLLKSLNMHDTLLTHQILVSA